MGIPQRTRHSPILDVRVGDIAVLANRSGPTEEISWTPVTVKLRTRIQRRVPTPTQLTRHRGRQA